MSINSGKLVILEGSDGSGKATQSALLVDALKKTRPVSFFEFPRYKQSNFGKLIKRSLAGEFGDFLELSPYLSSLPYMLDRARAKYLLLEALKEGDVVCDRYTSSNLAHQSVKLNKKDQEDFVNFVEESEYKELGLPRPDLVIYLYVSSDTSQKLMRKRAHGQGEKSIPLDSLEIKKEYQTKVVKKYLELAKKRKNWKVIRCENNKGKLLGRKAIHKKVIQIVKKELKIR